MKQIQDLQYGNAGSASPFITKSMVKVFIELAVLLADSASMASQHIDSLDADIKGASQSKDNAENARNSSPINSVRSPNESLNFGKTQIRDDDTGLADTRSNDMDMESLSTASDAQLFSENKCPVPQGSDFFCRRNDHIDQIYLYLIQAQQECLVVSCSEDDFEDLDTYNGVDRDLTLLREELDIIQRTVKKQLELVNTLRKDKSCRKRDNRYSIDINDTFSRTLFEVLYSASPDACGEAVINTSTRKVLKAIETDLQERTEVFYELIKQVERHETHIIQRVDIIQEDHGKATLIFTIVATIFLPLSFVSSYLGMNTADIRNMDAKQVLFWEVATPFTVVVVSVVLLVAYNARRILGWSSQEQL
ncbi:uncharacterized protein N7483_006403 [Penicillium malachiteum]|uniref:uncharacterized protein n=1 Tax=Penicillium malachiteum TaxID=1324776 RepID=UPI002546FDFD|nr:uncharacterized protein N7483_006403 [Penicillium malachiteum]KAJ5725046.1 hypothetical protein N7483_006403 [Penicillium malachiteum]